MKLVPAEAGSRDSLWSEFSVAWDAAVFALDEDILGESLALSERLEVPAAAQLGDDLMRRVLLWFVGLQWLHAAGSVHLSSHIAAEKFGMRPKGAWSITRRLEAMGLLVCVQRGIARVRSTHYRVSPDVMESVRMRPDDREAGEACQSETVSLADDRGDDADSADQDALTNLLAVARRVGFQFVVSQRELSVRGPASAVGLWSMIRQRASGLVGLLRQSAS